MPAMTDSSSATAASALTRAAGVDPFRSRTADGRSTRRSFRTAPSPATARTEASTEAGTSAAIAFTYLNRCVTVPPFCVTASITCVHGLAQRTITGSAHAEAAADSTRHDAINGLMVLRISILLHEPIACTHKVQTNRQEAPL